MPLINRVLCLSGYPLTAMFLHRIFRIWRSSYRAWKTYQRLLRTREQQRTLKEVYLTRVNANAEQSTKHLRVSIPEPDTNLHLLEQLELADWTTAPRRNSTILPSINTAHNRSLPHRSWSVGSLDLLPRRRGMSVIMTGIHEARRPPLESGAQLGHCHTVAED